MHKITVLLVFIAFVFQGKAQTDPLFMRYPAISPDGNTIAFSYQGDIYTVASKGGAAKRLTLHQAYEAWPIWSPDGKSIAFSSNRHGNGDVFLISAEGGTPQRLTFHSSNDQPSCFSPDGTHIQYISSRMDERSSVLFPSGVLPEFYEVSIKGGRERQVLTTPAIDAQWSPDGSMLGFHDQKGYEDDLRKHHQSSVARDLWIYSNSTKEYSQLTNWAGEDRNLVWASNNSFYFLSERSGSFNVWKTDIVNGKEANARAITQLSNHPIRSLSRSNNGLLSFSYNGELYTLTEGSNPVKVKVEIQTDRRYNEAVIEYISGNASDFELSPNGKEIAFIVRGEVFVTSVEFTETKRITDTPEQERDLSFNSDGSKLMFSAERNGSWNIYEASLARTEEKYFYNATLINEKALVELPEECFQASYSPDDKEIAFLSERTELKVKNLESGKIRTVVPGHYSYSYADGDQYYTWSPDSKWFLIEYFSNNRWNGEIGLVKASGEEEPVNLSKSGYGNSRPKFGMNGELVYWVSDKEGYRSHGSWGSQSDVYALFLTRNAHKKFSLSKSDYAFWKEAEEDKKKETDKDEEEANSKKKKKDKKDKKEEKPEVKDMVIEWDGLDDRLVKLTEFSSFVSDFLLDKEGEKMYYLISTGEGFDLWKTDFKENETKQFVSLDNWGSKMRFNAEESSIVLNNKGSLTKIEVADGSQKGISFRSEMNLNVDAERAYMFEHAWRQFKKKFYLEDLHGVDWDMYKANYAQYLPHINNKIDFADMLSEMLGEVNASHTGAFARESISGADATAALGVFFDDAYKGKGIRIAEVLSKSPFSTPESKVKAGTIIYSIDGVEIGENDNYWPLFNRKVGNKMRLGLMSEKGGSKWEEVVEPIAMWEQNEMLYQRWVKSREAEVQRLSGGKLGYVHVRGMDSESFREVYSKALGEYNTKDALIVDTRFNGGGWLHEDLATFLRGVPYMQFFPRGQDNMGGEPLDKWQKPSAVIMSESNYSDAHMFPYTYKFFNIGKLIGMPVPGTGTAVWWESMLDGTVFGIPQIGMRDVRTGRLLENNQLEPDIKVMNEPTQASNGVDQQLQAAVTHLLELNSK